MPDCEVGAFIKKKVDEEFESDYRKRVQQYVSGKVTARQMRCFYTHAIARTITGLYTNHKEMVKRAFQKTGVLIDLDGYDKHLIKVPNFETYKPPEADEEYREEEFTKEEIAEFEQQEILYRKEKKERAIKKRKQDQMIRNKERAKKPKIF